MTKLTLGGYKLITPLLACNITSENSSTVLASFEGKLQELINKKIADKSIDSASVYFRDITTGYVLDINPTEKYFPASLKKIPVMIAYYKEAETNPAILTTKVSVKGGTDYNVGQEIMPRQTAEPGKDYTIAELIDMMIKYSDNNAYAILSTHIGQDPLKQTYADLKVPFPSDQTDYPDFITTNEFSYFLRVLFNATYLNRDYSEKALEILSDVDFKDGLVAGIPSGTTVAHKYGLLTKTGPNDVNRELHDCGIVYHPKNPYLACVMTKSSGTIEKATTAIKEISELSYQEADSNYR